MKDQFTPGPWHVNSNFPTKVNGPEEAPGVLVDCGENVQYLEAFANAKLIAAAPELLSALRDMVDRNCVGCGGGGVLRDKSACQRCRAARAVIAKAT